MNALRDTPFTKFLSDHASELPGLKAIIAVSAHWESPRPRVNNSARPGTLHDFRGFPAELGKVQYPVPGEPKLAEEVLEALNQAGWPAEPEERRGLDHGVWAPLVRLFPAGQIPVVQVSIPPAEDLEKAWVLGGILAPFREKGCLVFASGNLVHNLGIVDFHRTLAPVESWAQDFDAWVKKTLLGERPGALLTFEGVEELAQRAHPSLEHYSPLLVAAGAAGQDEAVSFPFEGFEHGTISMRCVKFG